MRTVGKDCRFLNDRQDPAASSQVSVGKRVAERQQLPTSGVTVHLDDEGVAHYTCVTEGFIPGLNRK